MSVIFKEKHYDQLLIFLKNLTVVIIVFLILLTSFNFLIKNRVELLNSSLENLRKEEKKYQVLINNHKNNELQIIEEKYSDLLIKLANYSENISFNSIHFKNKRINLDAVSSQQKDIFNLIESLKSDQKFSEVRLLNINQREKYYFKLEILNLQ